MYNAARTALTVTAFIGGSFTLWANSYASAATADPSELSPEYIRMLDDVRSNPKLRQRALAVLNATSGKPHASNRSKSKAAPKPDGETQQSAGTGSLKKPDAITQLIQSNENKVPIERQYSPCAGFVFLLRQDWKDVGNAAGAACPGPAANAQGAQISFANNLAAQNRIVTIHGTAAVLYNTITGDVPFPLPYAFSIGAYATVDDLSNSASSQIKSNVDTLAYGGLINLGYANSVGGNYFMLRAGAVEDHIKDTTSASAVFDWSPVVYPLYIHYPFHWAAFGLPIITRFDTDFVGRFDSATGNQQVVAFNNMKQSLRIGPEMALTILPDPGYVSGPLSRFSILLGYDVWYETYSKNDLTWFTSSLNYNIDEAGNFGLKGTYNTGRDVNTGNWTNIYTIGLSGKI